MDKLDLQRRAKKFALRVLKLTDALPQRTAGARTNVNQLARAGTSVGSNYRAACKGRSRAEFVAKLGTVEEEADESAFWLELIIESELLKPKQVEPLLKEGYELTKIMAQSRISAARELARIMKRQTTSKMGSNRQSAIGNRQ